MPQSRREELEPKVVEHVRACWFAARPISLRSLAAAVGELRFGDAGEDAAADEAADAVGEASLDAEPSASDEAGATDWCSTALRNLWRKLEREGVLRPRVRLPGRFVTVFNWTGRPLDQFTLKTLIEPYLDDPTVRSADKQRLKEGLRKVLPGLTGVPLEGHRTDEMVLVAASRVAADVIPTLPGFMRAAPGKGEEYARAIRNAMRYALARKDAVIVLPTLERDDTWTAWMDEHLPLAETGRTSPETDRARRAVRVLREELEAMGAERRAPMPTTPDDCPAELASRALDRVLTVRADHRNHPIHRREVVRLGTRGLGPFRDGAHLGADLVVLADGRHPSPRYYLHSVQPERNRATWDALLATMRERGIAQESIEFVEWVRDYSTLTDRELAQRLTDDRRAKVFPTRRANLFVELGAESARIRAFRAFLGAAVNLRGLPPEECTPPLVFGVEFELLTDAVLEEWAKRVDMNMLRAEMGVPPIGSAKHASSTGPHGTITTAGVIALMAYERSVHLRGAPGVEVRTGQGGKVLGVDWNALRRGEKTVAEDAYARAYDLSRTKAGQMHADRGGALITTHKSKQVVYADTPTVDLMPAALEKLRRRIESKRKDDGLAFDSTKLLMAGIVASGTVRIEELAHIRVDRHLTAAQLVDMGFFLERWDRKGDYCEHHVPLHEALTPRWLIDYVLDVARHQLLARWTAKGNPAHAFVFMDRNGRPFGDPEESANGKVRNQRLVNTRKSKLILLFKDFRIPALKQAKLPILTAHGTHSPHGDRGRIANIGVNLKGVGAERTGRLLGHITRGDGQRASTAERSYSRTDLEANRETLNDILLSRPWYLRRHSAAAPVASTSANASMNVVPLPTVPVVAAVRVDSEYPTFVAERRAIQEMAVAFDLTPQQARDLLAEAMKRWGVNTPAPRAPSDLRVVK